MTRRHSASPGAPAPPTPLAILNHIVQYERELDRTFAALADPTRRDILRRLGRGSATISELAKPYGISLTGLKKHVRVLEDVGLVSTEKTGRTRRCGLGPRRLDNAQQWIETYRQMLNDRLERLGELLEETAGETVVPPSARPVRASPKDRMQAAAQGQQRHEGK
jgi:DNA-binding transcriptional ArsR family regulator